MRSSGSIGMRCIFSVLTYCHNYRLTVIINSDSNSSEFCLIRLGICPEFGELKPRRQRDATVMEIVVWLLIGQTCRSLEISYCQRRPSPLSHVAYCIFPLYFHKMFEFFGIWRVAGSFRMCLCTL